MGHFVGLLTPINVFDALGVSHSFKQTTALVVGGIAGVAAYVGCTLLLHRRLFDRAAGRHAETQATFEAPLGQRAHHVQLLAVDQARAAATRVARSSLVSRL